jgi:hypothetical protein
VVETPAARASLEDLASKAGRDDRSHLVGEQGVSRIEADPKKNRRADRHRLETASGWEATVPPGMKATVERAMASAKAQVTPRVRG